MFLSKLKINFYRNDKNKLKSNKQPKKPIIKQRKKNHIPARTKLKLKFCFLDHYKP